MNKITHTLRRQDSYGGTGLRPIFIITFPFYSIQFE